ncbi:MAG: amidohydrolase family protein [Lautropia sp.]
MQPARSFAALRRPTSPGRTCCSTVGSTPERSDIRSERATMSGAHDHASHRNAVDVHAHWYPQRFLDLLSAKGPAQGLEWRDTPKGPQFGLRGVVTAAAGPRFVDLDARLQAMDEQHVRVQALSLSQPMTYWAGRDLGLELCVVFNDELARAHEASPGRFVGLAALPMHEPELARREAERAAKLSGIRGVYVATAVLDRELSDPAFFPVYEALEGLGLPMFLHPVFVIGEQRLKAYYLSNLLGNPFESAIAAAHLIFGGVMDRYPRLQVVLPHAGGAFPWLVGRLNRGWEKRSDLQHIEQSPIEYLKRFWYDTIGYSDHVTDYLCRVIGPDRVLMGSDYCFPIADEQPVRTVIANPLLSDKDKKAIIEDNPKRLLKL